MNKTSKITSILVLIFTIIITGRYSYANNNQEKAINDMFTIETKEINEENEFYKENIKYSYLNMKSEFLNQQNINNKPIEYINKKISDDILKFKNQVKTYAQSYKEEYEKTLSKEGDMKIQYQAVTDYRVTYNKNNLISIPTVYYEYSGGAHGMSQLRTYNYDLMTGKEILLKDLFKDNCNYKDIIDKYIKDTIALDKGKYFHGENGFNGISNSTNYYLEDNSIVIYFGAYEIAPYSTGIPEFKIPINILSNCLKVKL